MMNNSRSAFALSIVLWIVAALMFGVTLLLIFSKQNYQEAKAIDEKLQTQLRVEEILEVIKYYTLTANSQLITLENNLPLVARYHIPTHLVLDDRTYNIDNNCSIQLMDTSGLINVFYFSPPLLVATALQNNTNRQKKLVMMDSLLDWTDTDNVVRLNGAENSTYKLKKRLPYGARNHGIIQDVEELHIIHGFDKLSDKEWDDFKKNTYFGLGAAPNPLLMSPFQLTHYFGNSKHASKSLIDLRSKDPNAFMTEISALEGYDDELFTYSSSRQIRITVRATVGRATSKLIAVISFQPTEDDVMTVMDVKLQ